ncbi:uncharacterized protein LOC110617891 [Manihot esculenta]|uniref:Uncharacterized protein n=1 Tax=Manihot esculenta TaxID=3983 RepID=A0A2C9VNF7_MANES|nr:uncharacterized protein LOC110617891 [Manihot esculenta]OAY47295.1 hypothetical protein MANES_06G067800v8 [Manihot esculenta]
MTRQELIRSLSPNSKTRSPLAEKPSETTTKMSNTKTKGENRGDKSIIKRCGEVAGGTTAECVAVCCCCPCALMNFLVLTIYKMPACLCRKARKRHRKRKHDSLLVHTVSKDSCKEELMEKQKAGVGIHDGGESDTGADELEKEMWYRFYATGFWRSPSHRSTR